MTLNNSPPCAYSSTVSAEEKERFIPLIDSILAASDLNTISEKRIRKGLQASVELDLNERKVRLPSSLSYFSNLMSLRMP